MKNLYITHPELIPWLWHWLQGAYTNIELYLDTISYDILTVLLFCIFLGQHEHSYTSHVEGIELEQRYC